MKHILLYSIVIFLFSACSSTTKNIDKKVVKKDKIEKTISLINNYYFEDGEKIHIRNDEKIYTTQEQIDKEIEKNIKNLDKYSQFIKSKNIKKHKKLHFSMTDKRSLYVHIPYFYKNLSKELSKVIKKNKSSLLILDLRNNPGGLLKEAVKTVDLFVNTGDIVSVETKKTNGTRTYRASALKTISNIPIVIMIDQHTASSAEIVSGALKDLNRATLIGTPTFGKRTIQSLIYLDKEKKEAIKLTIAKYHFPYNKNLDNKIHPDILVNDPFTIEEY